MENYSIGGAVLFVLLGLIWLVRGNFSEAATWVAIGIAFLAGFQSGEGRRDIPNRRTWVWIGILVAVVLYAIQGIIDFRIIGG